MSATVVMGRSAPPFRANNERVTTTNASFRRVLYTTPHMQLVVMSIAPGEDIPMERHSTITQLIRVESGTGRAYIGDSHKELRDDTLIIIPPNMWHRIVNTSTSHSLKLYSVYSPPEHRPGTRHRRRSDDPEIPSNVRK
jgi:mannose-6-phosphate isomerase-like protein (cupin superfamily)